MKALIEPRELSQRPRQFDLGVRQLDRLRRARQLVAAFEDLGEVCSIKRAGRLGGRGRGCIAFDSACT